MARRIPLALPAIPGEVHIAIVSTVGLVTRSARSWSHGGYGTLILDGFVDNFYHAQIMTATFMRVALTVVLESAGIERLLAPWSRTNRRVGDGTAPAALWAWFLTSQLAGSRTAYRRVVGFLHRDVRDKSSSPPGAGGHRSPDTQRARRLPRVQRRQRRTRDPDVRAAVHRVVETVGVGDLAAMLALVLFASRRCSPTPTWV